MEHIVVFVVLLIVFFVYFIYKKKLKKVVKYIFYSNIFAGFFRGKLLGVVLPGFAGAYYLALDIWGDQWPILVKNKDLHSTIFKVLIFFSLLSLIVRAIADWIVEKKEKDYVLFLQSLSVLTTKLVKSKLDRFKLVAGKLTPNGNTFKKLSEPDKQINLILTEIELLFNKHFGIKDDKLSIVITRIKNHLQDDMVCYHAFKNHKRWQRTKAIKIIENKTSIASRCLKTGESIFIADKSEASDNKHYYFSKRDKRKKIGSVFCYPSITNTNSYEDKYIICISTYEKILCDPDDRETVSAIRSILDDICRRLDLELTLYAIKDWQFDFCIANKN